MEKHLDASLTPTERADALLAEMSVEEKIGQLCRIAGFNAYEREGDSIILRQAFKDKFAELQAGIVYGVLRADWWTGRSWETGLEPRLMAPTVDLFQRHALENTRWHIPLIISEEAPHGLMALGCAVFPTGLGLGATWNPALMEQAATALGDEAAAAGIHSVYGPILDLAHDPRWSRVEEDFSEDPFLAGALGVAYVKGLQGGSFPKPGRPFSTLKHFAAHGDPEGGHNSAPAHLGPVELRNVQGRPFEACVKAGARSLMSAYNTIDGVPCAANRALLTDLLRGEWGFDGFVVADGGGVARLLWQRFGADEAEVSAKALKAGLDTSSCGCCDFHAKGLRDALERGLLTMADIDQAARRVLALKFRLGLFENPYLKTGKAVEVIGAAAHRAVALEMARQSLTLLANKADALPLKNVRRVAVIGPNADTPMNQLGDYTGPQKRGDIVTVLDGMRELGARHGAEIHYAKGCKVRSLRRDLFDAALDTAKQADTIVLVLGGSSAPDSDTGFLENGASRIGEVREDAEFDKESGEGYDRAKLRLGGLQLELLRALRALGKPLVTVLIMGRPLIVDEVVELSDAVLLAWYPGMEGGRAVAEALFGEYNPGGKLPISIPKDEAQLPVYYNSHQPRGNYIDLTGKPSFPFGFGLSYTTFEYSELTVGEKVSVKVKNSVAVDGDEVVQLYLTDQVASVARPWRELRGFQRVHLKAGETRVVDFTLGPQELGFYNQELKFVVEPGRFTVAVGGGLDSLLEAELTVVV